MSARPVLTDEQIAMGLAVLPMGQAPAPAPAPAPRRLYEDGWDWNKATREEVDLEAKNLARQISLTRANLEALENELELLRPAAEKYGCPIIIPERTAPNAHGYTQPLPPTKKEA